MKKIILIITLMVSNYVSYSQDTLDYTQMSIEYYKSNKTTLFDAIKLKDGSIYKVGDTLKIGKPFLNKSAFTYITLPKYFNMSSNLSGFYAYISKIKREGAYIRLSSGLDFLITAMDIAMENGEIIDTKKMTSDEALAQLKKEKDKFDLGLISKEEYETKKSELVKFIK